MAKDNKAFDKLKNDIKNRQAENIYLFFGAETYLRDHYLSMLKNSIVPDGFTEFNFHKLNGKGLSVQALADAVEALPMMAEKTLVLVEDMDIFKMPEEQRNQMLALVKDFPPYCCLVIVYDTVEYKPDKKLKIYKALAERAQIVEFQPQEHSDLMNWVIRHFSRLGKDIDRTAAEHLIFTCGSLMSGLLSEIEKIAAYTKGQKVTIEDINAVADPILEAVVFDITNAISRGDYNAAAESMGKLIKKQEEPIVILSMIGKELRKLYTARIALESNKSKQWLMDVWGYRTDYPAKLMMQSARNFTKQWCRDGIAMCRKVDLDMKSRTGYDNEAALKLLLMQLAQGAKRKS